MMMFASLASKSFFKNTAQTDTLKIGPSGFKARALYQGAGFYFAFIQLHAQICTDSEYSDCDHCRGQCI